MSLDPLRSRPKIKPYAVFDIETSTDLKRVYLVGYYDGRSYRFWESSPLPPDNPKSAITLFLAWLFDNPSKRSIYGHNAGNFDSVFALASIIANFPALTVEIIPSQSSILCMKVSDKQGHNWKFLDSARTLPDSLENLGQCFLDQGKVKNVDYETLHLDPIRYEYLKNDCVLLYDVLSKYFTLLYDKLGGTAGISAASTALATYRTSYQAESLPEISEHAASLARAGYYGGRCEPFRREFVATLENPVLYDFDVNSLYPSCMVQPQPVEELDGITGFHPELCGFVDCTVDVSFCHMPILPCRTSKKLLFPFGRWRGVFSTAELRLAIEHRQATVCSVHDAVYFKTRDIFSDYVNTLYAFRNKANPNWDLALDRMAKIGLNSLYGKFGSTPMRETIHIRPTLDDMIDKQMQQMPSSVSTDCYIERSERQAAYMLPQISAWITALGRCRLASSLLEMGENAYYCDTDAGLTTDTITGVGTGLGEWKNEYPGDPIVYAYFLAPKVYVFRHASGRVTNKAKGFSRFAEKLPPDAVAILATGKGIEVSRFAKARSVMRGDFGLILSQKRCHLDYEKRIFHEDGTSEPRRVELA